MSKLNQRLLMGTLSLILVLISVYFSTSPYFRPFFPILTTAFICCTVWEYCQMAFHKGYSPLNGLSIICSACYTFAVFFSTQTPYARAFPEICLLLTLGAFFVYYFYKGKDPLANIAVSIFPIVYLSIPLSCIISINYFQFPEGSLQDGRLWLLYAIATTKMADVGGYVFGKQFGTRLLSPMISPNKTWEGAIGGLICAIITSVLFSLVLPISGIAAIILGLLIAMLAQFGDLAESLLKRDTGFKDSNQMPGLGGTLDIADSLVFTIPFVYIFLLITHLSS